MMKKGIDFMKKHLAYNATIHALGGLGVGFIIAHYLPGANFVLWGIILVVLAVIAHIYAFIA